MATDPARPGEPEDAPRDPAEGGGAPADGGPYRNLFVPLVVVPAVIVVALVLVFVLFGAIAGHEASPRENVDRMLHGGANAREQAAFSLVRQTLEAFEQVQAGEEPEWELDPALVADVRTAWESTPQDDLATRYVLASLLALLDAPDGPARLVEILEQSAARAVEPGEVPPGGEPSALAEMLGVEDDAALFQFRAIVGLGALGPRLAEAGDRETIEEIVTALVEQLESGDHGIRLAAAGALQTLPSPRSLAALEGLIADGSLELRGQAAVSLSHLLAAPGAPEADPGLVRRVADVLRELLDPATFERERAANAEKFRSEERVRGSRILAVGGLARLGRAEDVALLREVAAEDDDLRVRQAALESLP